MDERVRLILELGGEAGVKQMATSVTELETDLKKMVVAWQSGKLATGDFLRDSAKLESQLSQTKDALGQLRGSGRPGGGAGQGILGASYAVQDFVSVLSGGQGLSRALASVTNNIGPIASGFGAGGALAGGIQLLGVGMVALVPIIEGVWKSFTGELSDKAKEKIKEIAEEIKKAHNDFVKLTETPFDIEKEAADATKDYLGQRPIAERAAAGAAEKMTRAEVTEAMNEADKEEISKAGFVEPQEDIDARAKSAEFDMITQGVPAELAKKRADTDRAAETAKRDAAIATRAGVENQVRQREAERLVLEAQKPGPAGNVARAHLGQMGAESPELFPEGFGSHMRSLAPDQIEADSEASDKAAAAHDEETEAWKQTKRNQKERRAERDMIRKAEHASNITTDREQTHRAEGDLEDARRMSNEVLSKATQQRQHPREPAKLQPITAGDTWNEAQVKASGNLIGLDAQIEADQRQLARLNRQNAPAVRPGFQPKRAGRTAAANHPPVAPFVGPPRPKTLPKAPRMKPPPRPPRPHPPLAPFVGPPRPPARTPQTVPERKVAPAAAPDEPTAKALLPIVKQAAQTSIEQNAVTKEQIANLKMLMRQATTGLAENRSNGNFNGTP